MRYLPHPYSPPPPPAVLAEFQPKEEDVSFILSLSALVLFQFSVIQAELLKEQEDVPPPAEEKHDEDAPVDGPDPDVQQ